MIEKDKIKWIKDEHPVKTKTYGQIYYKEVRLDLSVETIQSIYLGLYTEEDIEIIILDSYQRNLRIHRENKLKQLIDLKND